MIGNISHIRFDYRPTAFNLGLNRAFRSGGSGAVSGAICPRFPDDKVPGKKGVYTILAPLTDFNPDAEGGMSKVYLALDPEDYQCVLKVMIDISGFLPGPAKEITLRFVEEVNTTERVNHKNVIGIIDREPSRVPEYYFMEYVPENLRNFIEEKEQAKPLAASHIILRILRGLIAFSNAFGADSPDKCAHRDLKPENIFIERDEDGKSIIKVKVADFGLVKVPDSEKTRTGMITATPEYCAPEIILNGSKIADQRSDIFVLGLILYYLLTGKDALDLGENKRDFKAYLDQVRTLPERIKNREFGELKHPVPDEFWNIALKAAQMEPNDRFQSFQEFSGAVEAAIKKFTIKR
ncbi:MAG: serine/threonine-protein kinase [Candidatus Margulisiibacteriota bacterium]